MKPQARFALVVAAMVALTSRPSAGADDVVVLSAGGRLRTVAPVTAGPKGQEIALEDAAKGTDVTFSRVGDQSVTLRSGGREVTLENGKSLFSVSGQLKAMASPVRVVGERTYVSAPSAATVLGAALGQVATYRAAYRVLVIGPYEAPRLKVTNVVGPSSVESTLEFSRPVPYDLRKESNRLILAFQADVIETDFTSEGVPGRIVGTVKFERTAPPQLVFELGERFVAFRKLERDAQHVGLVFETSSAASAPPGPANLATVGTARPAPRPQPSPVGGGRRPIVLVIDPGHGGEDAGARGPGGRLEKDVTLALAKRLRAAAVDGLSVQAYLTRETDVDLALDERAAVANNFNADVFISIHANGSRVSSATGTEVFFLSYNAVDDEARRLALQEGTFLEQIPKDDGDVGLILWDMAQAAQLEASSRLAGNLHSEIALAALSRSRGVRQAPFRVLVGATMPAALVEVGFITNADEEKRLFSDAHQTRLTNALVRGLGQFVAALRPSP